MKRLLIASLLTITFTGCMGYVPGQQSYWDAQVKEMCEKDGGVQIFEKLRISKTDIHLLERTNGNISVLAKNLSHPNAPAYAVNKVTILKEGNPSVWRSEWNIVRRVDKVIVARWVAYSRSGGEVPSPAHGSRITCPDLKK